MAQKFMYGLDTCNPNLFIMAKGITLVDAPKSNMQLCKTKSPMHKEIKKGLCVGILFSVGSMFDKMIGTYFPSSVWFTTSRFSTVPSWKCSNSVTCLLTDRTLTNSIKSTGIFMVLRLPIISIFKVSSVTESTKEDLHEPTMGESFVSLVFVYVSLICFW